ncbi:MAG: oligosaccharide flippase family protein [Sphaerobacter sp.]|nr:oligosaccharide flippase family protein [Sphaerobacter sp.]
MTTATASPPSVRTRALGLLGANLWGIADQGLISGGNFVTMVLLARTLGGAGFGVFTLVYTILTQAYVFQTALVTQPHNVLGATCRGEPYVRYTTATAVWQAAYAGLCAALALLAALAARLAFPAWTPLLVALAGALLGWQLQEFARRVLYTEGRLGAAFASDVVRYGLQVGSLALLWRLGRLTGPVALGALATAAAVAAALGWWQIRGSLGRALDTDAIRRNWDFGKWLAAGGGASWLSDGAYLYLAAALLGAHAAGLLRAAEVLFGPLRALMAFVTTILPIRFARARGVGGEAALRGQLKSAYRLVIPLVGIYGALMALAARPALALVYGDEYLDGVAVLAWYAAYLLAIYAGDLVAAALKARGHSRPLFAGQMVGLVAIPVGWLLVLAFGVEGAVLAMTLSAVLVLTAYWHAFLRHDPRRGATELEPVA